MVRALLYRRMMHGALLLAAYGIWVAGVGPGGHLPLGARIAFGAWAIALFAGTGAVLGAVVTLLAIGGARTVPVRYRTRVAAGVETVVLLPLVAWLVLNEFVYAVTSEVVGRETIMMAWSNMAATFEAAWEMGGRYLVAAALLTLAMASAIYWTAARSFRRLYRPAPVPAAPPAWARWRRFPIGGSLTGGLLVLSCMLTWQICTKPSAALTAVFRAAPPLRALNLTRAIVGNELIGSGRTLPQGEPLISDGDYQASLGAPPKPAPNVVLIVLESVSATALHCYGYPRTDITSNMDALAGGGVLFEHCWGTASFSSYGLVSIMTSLHMLRAEHNDHFADTAFPIASIPKVLKLAGYETAIFSSGNESFDHINDFYPPSEFDRYYSHDTSGLKEQKDCMRMDDLHAVGEFEKWMATRDGARPFYCSFYLQSTHFNYEVPEPWASHYQPTPPLFSNGDAIIRIRPETLPLLRNQYDNSMRYSDHWIGRIRAAIERAGGFENTIVVITADHGEAFMEHGMARHGVHLWEEMIRVPLIIYAGPKVRDRVGSLPSRLADTVSGVDIAPTIAGLVGIRAHPSWQGVDLLKAGCTSLDRPVFSVLQLTKWQEAICLNGWKYIYDLSEVQPYLFDLNADPGERVNLAETEPEIAIILRTLLADWHEQQIAYYDPARRPLRHYIGRHEPHPELLARFRTLTQERVLTARR